MGKYEAKSTGFGLGNKLYDVLKWTAQILIPGLATLYFTVATLWGLPHVEEVLGTLTAIGIFLGVILGLSSKAYNNSDAKYDGEMIADTSDPDKDVFSLELGIDTADIPKKKDLTLKVVNPADPGSR